jgi:hypothetical protein
VPFTADSELWPYPRAPVDDRSHSTDNEDVLELDFADTSALSNPSAFQEKEKANAKGKEKKEPKKKGKKERGEEIEKDREEIERSWDVPATAPPTPSHVIVNGKGKTFIKRSSSPVTNGLEAFVDPDAVKASMVSTLSSQNVNMAGLPRNEFVREVLTLIHVRFGLQLSVMVILLTTLLFDPDG